MLYLLTFFAALLFAVSGQQSTCLYTVNNGPNAPAYTLNLTSISDWTLEKEENGINYYYTPCRNGLRCYQGSAEYFTNAAQFKAGANQCIYYLSVDHHENAQYTTTGDAFYFEYEDGELCEQTNQPRRTRVYYQCAEGAPFQARLTEASETHLCDYLFSIESPLACVPENQQNAECIYSVKTPGAQTLKLDLSSLRDIQPLRFIAPNHYRFYYSPCQNSLNCYQQTNGRQVMAELDNSATGTCELFTAIWENGGHQPFYLSADPETFQFRFYNGEPCNGGSSPAEQVINYICDRSANATAAQVINATAYGPCRYEFNIASNLACVTSNMQEEKNKKYNTYKIPQEIY